MPEIKYTTHVHFQIPLANFLDNMEGFLEETHSWAAGSQQQEQLEQQVQQGQLEQQGQGQTQ